MRVGLAVVCALLAACLPDNLVQCADGRLCPAGTVCDAVHVSCVSPAQSSACADLADGDRCSAAGTGGICDLGVCLPGCGDGTTDVGEECDDGDFASHDGCSSTCVREELRWQRWQSPWRARVGHTAAYHAAAGLLVVFGGHDGTRLLADHWQRSTTGWSAYTGAQPPARRGAAMTYDSARQRIILWGGIDSSDALLADTWEFDGSVWIQRTPTSSPSPRVNAAMAFDSLRNRTIMFGGAAESEIVDETWEYNGTTWTKITTTGVPAARSGAAMAWNPNRQRVMMFGGSYALFGHNDTWEYNPNNSTWTQLQNGTPEQRFGSMMAFSTDLGEMVLFGGHYGTIEAGADTWTFTGLGWVQLTTGATAPGGRFDATLTQDTVTGELVMIGGSTGAGALDDIWSFDGEWTPRDANQSPSARVSMMIADNAHQRLSLFSGLNSAPNDFWQFDGTRWVRGSSGPAPRFHHALGYDESRDRTILYGGFSNFVLQDTTEERDGTTGVWSLRTDDAIIPPARGFAGMAYEPSAASLVMFSGDLFGLTFADTWELTAAGWTESVGEHPPGALRPAMASDPVGQRVLLFDTSAITWSFSNHAWTRLDLANAPPGRVGAVLSFDRARGYPVLYGGYEDLSLPSVWELVDDAWRPLEITGDAPPSREAAGFVYDRWRHAFVLFGGFNASGYFDDTWLLQWRSTTPDENCSNGVDDDEDRHVDADDPDC